MAYISIKDEYDNFWCKNQNTAASASLWNGTDLYNEEKWDKNKENKSHRKELAE